MSEGVKIVRILSKKLIIALMAISMATFPALNANAQAGAGAIAGVSATTVAIVAGVIVVGAVAASDSDSGRPDVLAPVATSTNPTVAGQTPAAAASSTTTN